MGKILIICLALSFFACSSNADDKGISNKEMKKILALSNMIDLSKMDKDIDKDLLLRVYEVPVFEENDCFPESHGVCTHDYYISASQYDEDPEYNVFKIGTFGQITKFKWRKTDQPDTAEIEIFTTKYSLDAQKYNDKLPKIENRFLLKVNVNGLKVVPEKN
jgi:hypothetical protein